MTRIDYPVTPAVRVLRENSIPFVPHTYTYEEHGGTQASALALNVSEHQVIKTLVMETDGGKPLLVLMHGDFEVSTNNFARVLGVKKVEPASLAQALKHTGYQFGGTSPFGTRNRLPVYAEKTIFDLPRIYINGGKRGFLVEIMPTDLQSVLSIVEVDVAIKVSPGS
ncbi:MAG: aminoacyl-tRNA deacylase [Ignavibacteriales bacterium]|nr:aminoacyl-tRNA deacylase [Ignavibacteriales bacterium]